ncbi:MAG: DUF4167 domain-containing protein [Novosphingobium sp.]
MNNNNRGNSNNNRRRGRGNNNRQGGGGGQQTNRIDSRARGNAPQMLEKYRKLAHDAHLNGDRVQSEYYLQFADHYFRVIADTRLRQEEQRARRDERWEGQAGETVGEDDFSVESDFPTFDAPSPYASRREREERAEGQGSGNGNRHDRPERQPRRDDRADRAEPQAEQQPASESAEDGGEAAEPRAANPYEPPENPFVRPNRNARGLRPRREDRRPQGDAGEGAEDGGPPGFDASLLPPSIAREEEPATEAPAEKPRRRAPRRKIADEGGDAETAASVG